MTLTKDVKIDKIEILEDGQIQLRQSTIILEDGVEIMRTYFRKTISPGEDFSKEDARVQSVATLIQTKEVVDAYKAKTDAQLKERDL
ncbi:MAG TPA: hypothetical protein PLW50_00475 [Smithellaceae bacterium]|nr:hypothetical protein [Smithellaceae bacterium]